AARRVGLVPRGRELPVRVRPLAALRSPVCARGQAERAARRHFPSYHRPHARVHRHARASRDGGRESRGCPRTDGGPRLLARRGPGARRREVVPHRLERTEDRPLRSGPPLRERRSQRGLLPRQVARGRSLARHAPLRQSRLPHRRRRRCVGVRRRQHAHLSDPEGEGGALQPRPGDPADPGRAARPGRRGRASGVQRGARPRAAERSVRPPSAACQGLCLRTTRSADDGAAAGCPMTQSTFPVGGPAMHPRSPSPRPWVVPLGLLLAVTRCGDVAGPGGYTVTYRASLAGIARIDSIYYDNGSGKCASNCTADSTMQRLVAPTVPATNPSWVVVLSNVPPGPPLNANLSVPGITAATPNLV